MTIEEVIKIAKGLRTDFKCESDTMVDFCNTIIKALEQQPCEDCISRQAVENITWEEPSYTDPLNVLTEIREKVRALPSVTPKEKSEYEHDHEVVKAYNDGQAYILDKIKAEVEAKCCITVGRENDGAITLYDIFEIIDKYRGGE